MGTKRVRQATVLGSFLVLAGVLVLLQDFADVSAWLWFALLVVCGLAALLLYIADPPDTPMLAMAYLFLALGGMAALIMLGILRDEGVAVYVLSSVALPFLALFVLDRRKRWALIPAYVLLAVALMTALLGTGLLEERLVPSFVMFATAIPFFAVYGRDRRKWWALVPAGVMTGVAVVLLAAAAALQWVLPALLILAGVWILARTARRRYLPVSSGSSTMTTFHADQEKE